MSSFFQQWKNNYHQKSDFSKMDRRPYFKIAEKYLPENNNATVIDIGSGDGLFVSYLGLKERYSNLYLLDGNDSSIVNLKKKYKNAILYLAPSKLPFGNNRADYIHTSHLIEHLTPSDLYVLLKETDRVLKRGGILVISAPMLWGGFYNDLTHVRPYNPESITHYLCFTSKNKTKSIFTNKYKIKEIAYRYTNNHEYSLGSDVKLLDFMIFFIARVNEKMFKFRKYRKNAYTLVLEKK